MSRLDDLTVKYDSQRIEVDAGRVSLKALEEEEAALSDIVTVEGNRIRKMREQAQFGRADYPKDVQASDAAALGAERRRLEALQLDIGRLRRTLREKTMALRSTGNALTTEQRKTAAPMLLASARAMRNGTGLIRRRSSATPTTGAKTKHTMS